MFTNDLLLNKIASHLMIHSSPLKDLSLYRGKMGILLFFAHYYHYTDNIIYDNFASDLLEEVYEEIDDSLPVYFGNGLAGIGWAFEYLLQNNFMDSGSSDILQEIDKRIMQLNPSKIDTQEDNEETKGILYYMKSRIDFCQKENVMPFDEEFLQFYIKAKQNSKIPDQREILKQIIPTGKIEKDFFALPLGLQDGCAGYGLNLLL